MTSKIISKENIPKLIDAMMKDFVVFGTTTNNNVPTLREISDPKEILIDVDLPMISIKKLFHPAQKDLFNYNRIKGVIENDIENDNKKIVVFGVRPCDITGNNLLDEIFKHYFADEFYSRLRKKALIIGINCLEPCYENCFCESMNSNDPKSGYDMMLTEISTNDFLVVPNSDDGKRILQLYSNVFNEPTADDFKKYVKKLELKNNNFSKYILIEGLPSELEDKFESSTWKKYTKLCLFCGSCTFICPTCYCYNVKDQISIDLEKGTRRREWDSCYYPEFALVAGGHDFRHDKERRFRYRYLHKFIDVPRRFKNEGCVGCGRCITYCPADIDVREVLKEVRGEQE